MQPEFAQANIRRHIGHHRNVYVQILFQFRTVDCIVGSDVEIVCISRHCIVQMCIRDRAMQPEFAQENIRRTVEQICRIFF